MAMALMLQELNAANFSSGNADSGYMLTADGSGGASWEAPAGGGGANYRVYTALLVQSSENDPVATVLENTLGCDVTWEREDVGYYSATSSIPGVFTSGKTICFPMTASILNGGDQQVFFVISLVSTSKMSIYCFDTSLNPADLSLSSPGCNFEIRVYS